MFCIAIYKPDGTDIRHYDGVDLPAFQKCVERFNLPFETDKVECADGEIVTVYSIGTKKIKNKLFV